MLQILAHIVLYQSSDLVLRSIESLLEQQLPPDVQLRVLITSNEDAPALLEKITARFGTRIEMQGNAQNLGFCGAQNQAVRLLQERNYEFLLLVNPDVVCEAGCIAALLAVFTEDCIGSATPLLLRCDAEFKRLSPSLVDAAGMELHSSLRHMDRGSGDIDTGKYSRQEVVFGGTGAFLLLKRTFIDAMILPRKLPDTILWSIYPQLEAESSVRPQLFDEAFFAYREDADLSWRGKNAGWKCIFVPSAVALHIRRVTPQRRGVLPPELNLMSVRNRFLLQFNNLSWNIGIAAIVNGLLFRNIVVIFGVLLREQGSLPALWQAILLAPRALGQRGVRRSQ